MKQRYKNKRDFYRAETERLGKLIKLPCRDCKNNKVQAHHPDYAKPLDVIWLCSDCHMREHGRLLPPNKRGNGKIEPIMQKCTLCGKEEMKIRKSKFCSKKCRNKDYELRTKLNEHRKNL